MEASTPFSNIPNEIIQHILLQLPVKSVIRCQCVCKHWRSMIEDSDFKFSDRGPRRLIIVSLKYKRRDSQISRRNVVRSTGHHLRLKRHKRPFGEASPLERDQWRVTALCACNGFVLLESGRDYWLWNPSTRCSTKVLESPYPEIRAHLCFLGGLCYDPCTRDYKVVLLVNPNLGSNFVFPFVISANLNHKEWQSVQFPYKLKSYKVNLDFRNTFHWLVRDWEDNVLGGDRNGIVYFDSVRDEFRILPTPKLRENSSIVGLGVIDDCLCMACVIHKQEEEPRTGMIMQVLIMKEYGTQESWITAFAIPMHEPANPYEKYGFSFYSQKNNAKVLFLRKGLGRHGHQAYVYNRKKDKLKEVLMDILKPKGGSYIDSMFFNVES